MSRGPRPRTSAFDVVRGTTGQRPQVTAANALSAHGTGQAIVLVVEECVGTAGLGCLPDRIRQGYEVISGRTHGNGIGFDAHDLPSARGRQAITVHLHMS